MVVPYSAEKFRDSPPIGRSANLHFCIERYEILIGPVGLKVYFVELALKPSSVTLQRLACGCIARAYVRCRLGYA